MLPTSTCADLFRPHAEPAWLSDDGSEFEVIVYLSEETSALVRVPVRCTWEPYPRAPHHIETVDVLSDEAVLVDAPEGVTLDQLRAHFDPCVLADRFFEINGQERAFEALQWRRAEALS
jgi:hypothetical protein